MPVYPDGTIVKEAQWNRLISSIPSSYTIYKDAGTYRAECNLSNGTDFSDSDASTVIQLAIDALPITGGKLHFKHATYMLSHPISCLGKYSVALSGEDHLYTILYGRDLDDYALQLSSEALTIENIRIDGGVKFYNSGKLLLSNVRMRYPGVGRWLLYLQDSSILKMSNCVLGEGETEGAGLCFVEVTEGSGSASDLSILGSLFYGGPNYLLYFKGFSPPSYFYGATLIGNYIEPYYTLPAHGIEIYNCQNIRIQGNTIAGRSDVNHDLLRIDGDGVDAVRSYRISVLGNHIWNSGVENRYGIYLGEAHYIDISHNPKIFGQTKGLYISNSAYKCHITYNHINSIENLAVGQDLIFEGNFGYVTKNSGLTGAIATGATVNHGLAGTPTAVSVTAAESGPTDIYVSDVGAATFAINYGGGGTKTFYWKAEYRP